MGCAGGGGGGVATVPPASGLPCAGSPIVLGTDNLPGNTSGTATTVVNITAIENSQSQVAGWLYETDNGNFFYQGNAKSPSVAGTFAALFPGSDFTSAFLNAIDTPQQVDQTQLNAITGAEAESGYTEHDCFSSNLPIG